MRVAALLLLPALLSAQGIKPMPTGFFSAGGGGSFAEQSFGSQRVSSGANNAVDSDTTAYPGSVSSGTLLIVAGAVWGSTAAPTSVVVSGCSGSWTTVLGAIPSGLTWRTFIAYGTGHSAGACTVTVNPAGTDSTHSFSYAMDEFTGQHGTPASVDGGSSTGIQSTGTSGTASDDITTATAGELIIGVMSHDTGDRTLTVAGSATTIGETETNGNNQCSHVVFQIATTAITYTISIDFGSGTGNANPGWSLQTHSFKHS